MGNKKVFFWSIVVTLGGFLFGFDTAVISGAEKSIQQLRGLNVFEHGLGGNTFLVFSGMIVLQLLFVWRLMPETKGISLEQIGKRLSCTKYSPTHQNF